MRKLLFLVLAAALAGSPWVAGDVFAQATTAAPAAASPGDARQVRVVIEAQLKAFAADDAAKAYGYATPAIRELFGSPAQFMAMVRGAYPVLLNPATVVFLKAVRAGDSEGDELLQSVQLTDAAGKLWLATYRMQRQADKSWRIGGCELAANQGRAT